MYIGEVLDIYAKGSSSRYGSVLTADGISGLSAFSLQVYQLIEMAQHFFTVDLRSFTDRCYIQDDNNVPAPHFAGRYKQKFSLYTCAPISHCLRHVRPTAFADGSRDIPLTDVNSAHWQALTAPDVKGKLTIKTLGQHGK